jgi:hypothetical protein
MTPESLPAFRQDIAAYLKARFGMPEEKVLAFLVYAKKRRWTILHPDFIAAAEEWSK